MTTLLVAMVAKLHHSIVSMHLWRGSGPVLTCPHEEFSLSNIVSSKVIFGVQMHVAGVLCRGHPVRSPLPSVYECDCESIYT